MLLGLLGVGLLLDEIVDFRCFALSTEVLACSDSDVALGSLCVLPQSGPVLDLIDEEVY